MLKKKIKSFKHDQSWYQQANALCLLGCGTATRMTDMAVVGLLMPFSEAENLVHPRTGWTYSLFQLYFVQAGPAFLTLAPKHSMLGHRKIPPHPRAFHSCVPNCSPHRLPFVILTSLGSNYLLLVFRVAKTFLSSLLLSILGSARKRETFCTQDDVNNCRHCFASSF